MIADKFRTVLDDYLKLIEERRPMVMYRFGDGELMLVEGLEVGANTQASRVDRWGASAGLSALGRDLQTVLGDQGPSLHFGIPCTCCAPDGYVHYKNKIQNSPLFPANLFINGNYNHWIESLSRFERLPIAVIVNERADTRNLPFMNVVRQMKIPDDCVRYYESHREEILENARNLVANTSKTIVFVAAGPLSEMLIYVMWNANPSNTYVDVGSSFDEMLYEEKTRPYMDDASVYAAKRCALPGSPEAVTSRFENKSEHLKVSLVINTACADPIIGDRTNPYRVSPYRQRAAILENDVLPRTSGFDEVIVAGVFPSDMPEKFPDIQFVWVEPQRHDRWDALTQREEGARLSTGDVIAFCHDDHAPGESLADCLRSLPADVDILVPKRVHLMTGASLNNGRADNYMGGHCYAMRRWIWAKIPLTVAPDEYWDIYLTPLWRAAGATIAWTDVAVHYDCEAREHEL